MTGVLRRLVAIGVVLAFVAGFTCTHLLGEPARDKEFRNWRQNGGGIVPVLSDQDLTEDLAVAKFAANPVVRYDTRKGDTLFALQVKPKLEAAPARPIDYLILVDTSASQNRGPLDLGTKFVEAVAGAAKADDRFAIWTVNVETKDLTRGFKPADDLKDAFKALQQEYPSGAVNLKTTLSKVVAVPEFALKNNRQRVVLYLGDGLSVLNPFSPEDRAAVCKKLVASEVAFFPVPLGPRLDPQNLHGLASGTGGTAVRLQSSDKMPKAVERLHEILATPIFYPNDDGFKLADNVTEAYPTKLPPLRSDTPTLVAGKAKPGKDLSYTLEGTANGKKVVLRQAEKLPESSADNFFLVGMVDQWKEAKDQPALLRSDRALAFAQEQNVLVLKDLLAKAEWAVADNKFDAAWRLFEQARQLDPNDAEAKAGVEVTKKLIDGTITRERLQEQLKAKPEDMVVRIEKAGKTVKITREKILALNQEGDKPIAPGDPVQDPFKDEQARQAVEDQRVSREVDEAIRQATRTLRTDPDRSHDDLKRVIDAVSTNPHLSNKIKQSLVTRLESALRRVDTEGPRVKRDLEERLRILAEKRARDELSAAAQSVEDHIRERMRVFTNLMHQAREERAYAQAQAIRQDLVNQGIDVPPAVTAGYSVALAGHHLREIRELYRVRQERFLQTLLQVEKSAIPFPDEPPIQFPPAATWKALTDLRKERYESSGFIDQDIPEKTRQRMRELRSLLSTPITFGPLDDPKTTLKEALGFLAVRYDVTILINQAAFKNANVMEVETLPVAEKPIDKMANVSFDTVLRTILSKVPNATYIIRRDYIEITTEAFQQAEKVVRVYPVEDLVIPIPNAINQQSLLNSASIFGFAGSYGAGGGLNLGIGGLNLGVGGLNLGVGGLNLGVGGLNLGVGGLNLGIGGGLNLGVGGLNLGIGGGLNLGVGGLNLGIGGANLGIAGVGGGLVGVGGNLGAFGNGGGNLGVSGGALGQFGNLGGQFGIQGGNTSQLLILLIRQVVGKPSDWAPLGGVNQVGQPPGLPDPNAPQGNPEGNDLGYYPPAGALVVKAPSRIHTRLAAYTGPAPGPGMVNVLDRNRDPIVMVPKDPKGRVAGAGEGGKDLDPKKMWQDALANGVNDPGLIIAVAEYLAQHQQWDHVVEFLKADLRQGIVVRPWVYESLAVALRESKASPAEIERAEVSVADLEPLDAQGFLRAAQAMRKLQRHDHALAFCRQAALLEPNAPYAYADALVSAEVRGDREAMEWAAGNLVRRDWPLYNHDYQAKAEARLEGLARALERSDKKADAEKLKDTLKANRQRDLVIRLTWQGEADLDLKVEEPTGSVCSCLNRVTIGGGTLLGDTLADMTSESYVAAQAFPGEYKITVNRVWGKPLSEKARLEIIQHQGTPEQHVRLINVDLKAGKPVTIKLDDGRRTSLASVPPPESLQRPPPELNQPSSDSVFTQLRSLADPTVTGFEAGMRGGVGAPGAPETPRTGMSPHERNANDRVARQTKVEPFVANTVDLTAQATISADRRYVRLSLTPFFNTVTRTVSVPQVNVLSVPGFRPSGLGPP